MLAPYDEFKRRVTIRAVDINTGDFIKFDQNNTGFHEMAKAAVASGSIAGVFAPFSWAGKGLFVDGHTAWNVDVEDAISQCLDLVSDESQITLDILTCGNDYSFD